jgi:hypothetical protein
LVILTTIGAHAAEIVRVPINGTSMSADGHWFGGFDGADRVLNAGEQAVIWSRDQGVETLGIPPGNDRSSVQGISADGFKVIGNASPNAEAFLWTTQVGILGLGSLLPGSSASTSYPRSMADDGTTVGRVSYGTRNDIWMLSADGHVTTLGLPPGAADVTSLSASRGGNVVVGTATNPNRAFIWDRQDGFRELGGGIEFALVSEDGSAIAGRSNASGLPYRWTRDEGAVPLPTLPDWPRVTGIYDITPDGSIIVGELSNASTRLAFVWDELHGTQDLRNLLIDQHGFTDAELPSQIGALLAISEDAMTLGVLSVSGFVSTDRWAIYLDKPLVEAVPEPSTYALSLMGASFVAGAMLRRMRSRQAPG